MQTQKVADRYRLCGKQPHRRKGSNPLCPLRCHYPAARPAVCDRYCHARDRLRMGLHDQFDFQVPRIYFWLERITA